MADWPLRTKWRAVRSRRTASAAVAGVLLLMSRTVMGMPAAVIRGIEIITLFVLVNYFSILANYLEIKCLLQAWIDGDMVGAVEETGPDVSSIAGFAASAPARFAIACCFGIGNPARRLLGQFFARRSVVQLVPRHARATHEQYRNGRGQGRSHPAALGKRKCSGSRTVNAQCRRHGARAG